jgi:hypothetical protein
VSLNNLAGTRPLFERALAIKEKVLGPRYGLEPRLSCFTLRVTSNAFDDHARSIISRFARMTGGRERWCGAV